MSLKMKHKLENWKKIKLKRFDNFYTQRYSNIQLIFFLYIYLAGNELDLSKCLITLFSHSWPSGGLKSSLATQA